MTDATYTLGTTTEIVLAIISLGILAICTIWSALRNRNENAAITLYAILFPISQVLALGLFFVCVILYQRPATLFLFGFICGPLCAFANILLFQGIRNMRTRELTNQRQLNAETQLQNAQALQAQAETDAQASAAYLAELDTALTALLNQWEDSETALPEEEYDCMGSQPASEDPAAILSCAVIEGAWCENPVIDALMTIKASAARKVGSELRAVLILPKTLSVADSDLCAVFGNLLDNAIKACGELATAFAESSSQEDDVSPVPLIIAKARPMNGHLVIQVSNPLSPKTDAKSTSRRRAKGADRHGWGLQIVETIAESYNGSVIAKEVNGLWESSVILRLSAEA